MKRTWTIIGVADVPESCKWYQSLLGLPETAPAHDDFGQIVDSDGTVLLCLHEWGAHEHPTLTSPHDAKPGNGLLLCSSGSTTLTWPCQGRARSSAVWKKSHM
jgi:catechol 2,3-dioxygenase-like lactoylglutathione lyase family enzyme